MRTINPPSPRAVFIAQRGEEFFVWEAERFIHTDRITKDGFVDVENYKAGPPMEPPASAKRFDDERTAEKSAFARADKKKIDCVYVN